MRRAGIVVVVVNLEFERLVEWLIRAFQSWRDRDKTKTASCTAINIAYQPQCMTAIPVIPNILPESTS